MSGGTCVSVGLLPVGLLVSPVELIVPVLSSVGVLSELSEQATNISTKNIVKRKKSFFSFLLPQYLCHKPIHMVINRAQVALESR